MTRCSLFEWNSIASSQKANRWVGSRITTGMSFVSSLRLNNEALNPHVLMGDAKA